MDREKVIKGLENCKEGGSCDGCQYDFQSSRCIFHLHSDALALLNDQEEEIKRLKGELHDFGCLFGKLSEEAEKAIADQPQIVRCKDCKNRNDSLRCPLELLKNLLEYTKVFTYGIPDDWFCADGERRTE